MDLRETFSGFCRILNSCCTSIEAPRRASCTGYQDPSGTYSPMKTSYQTLLILIVFTCSPHLKGADDAKKVTFVDDVLPILENKCANCHNPDESKGGLDLSSFSATLIGGSGGEIVVSQDAGSSRIFTLAAHKEEPFMPPKGTAATEKELKVISDWITGGLLETKSSKARKTDKPKIDFDSITSTGKPEGPPAMPEHLILQPEVVAARSNAVPALAHSPWAPILAVAGQKQILLYHSEDYDLLGVLPYPEGFPQTLNFSPNGAYLSCGGGRGGKSGNVVAWDLKTGERIIEVGKEYDIVLGADVSPDLKTAVMGGPGRSIKLWDTVAGEQINSIKKHSDWMLCAGYSPDGVIFATGGRNGGLYVWEAATGYEFYTLKGHTKGVTGLDWRADGNVLASCSEDGQVMLWEMTGGKQIKKWEAHKGGVLAIAYAPDGKIATVGRDKTAKIWEGDGKAIRSIAASDDIVLSVAFSHDSKRVFTGDWNGNIKVWDAENGTEIATIDPNPPTIDVQLAYSEKRITELTTSLPKLELGVKAISTELAKAREGEAAANKALSLVTTALNTQKAAVTKLDAQVKALTPQVDQAVKDLAAKNAAAKTTTVASTAANAALKAPQVLVTKLIGELKTREAALLAATTALNAAKAEAAKPALDDAQKKQHAALAAAQVNATKVKQAADAALAAKTAEVAAITPQSQAANKAATDAKAQLDNGNKSIAAAQGALTAVTAARASADAALVAASKDGKTPPMNLVDAQMAAAAKEREAQGALQNSKNALVAVQVNQKKAADLQVQIAAKLTAANTAAGTLKQDQANKNTAFTSAGAAFKPLQDAAVAGAARVAQAKVNLTAKTTSFQQNEKARNDHKVALDKANASLAAAVGNSNTLKTKLAAEQAAAKVSTDGLAAKQKQLADSKTQLVATTAEMKKSEAAVAASTKARDGAKAVVAAVVKKDADSKKSIELAKLELENTKFLKKKWQAAAINLTAHKESENLDDMKFDLEDMKEGEVVAKNVVTVATKARTEAESTLASAQKTVVDGTMQLKEKSSSVLERALKLVASRAVAELREGAIQKQPGQNPLTLASNTTTEPPFKDTVEDGMEEEEEKIEIVAAQTLSYKTPDEINAEVDDLKKRLIELEQFLATTYQEADKTKTTVDMASKVARETPKLIAERTEAEKQAAKELTDAEAERKRQEQILVEQAKKIDELKKKYIATFPKRD